MRGTLESGMYQSPSLDSHLANLDILRAIAVLSVVVHHVFAVTGFHVPYFSEAGGFFGVQLFFIISGYLISESASKYPLATYAKHRFFRIFPAYWVAFIGVGLLYYDVPVDRALQRPGSLVLSLLNLQQLYAVALLELDPLHVTWTLTVEMFWYLLAPLMVVAYRRWAWITLGMLALTSVLWVVSVEQHRVDALYAAGFAAMTEPTTASQRIVLMGWAFPAQMVFFGLGAMVYRYREQALRIGTTPLLVCMFFSLALLEHYIGFVTVPPIPMGLGVTAFFILMLRAPAVQVPLLAHIGKISYSIYLLHFPAILWVFHHFGHFGKIHLALTAFAIFGCSHLMYVTVERPCIRFARRKDRPKAPKQQ